MELSSSDRQILQGLKDGLIVKEIAEKVGKTPFAVQRRIEKLRKKNQAGTTTQLVAKLVSLNLL